MTSSAKIPVLTELPAIVVRLAGDDVVRRAVAVVVVDHAVRVARPRRVAAVGAVVADDPHDAELELVGGVPEAGRVVVELGLGFGARLPEDAVAGRASRRDAVVEVVALRDARVVRLVEIPGRVEARDAGLVESGVGQRMGQPPEGERRIVAAEGPAGLERLGQRRYRGDHPIVVVGRCA